jgi:vanillate O-demethylase ferredoxin subunit
MMNRMIVQTGAVPVSPDGYLKLRVAAIRFEAETIRSVELVSPDGGALPAFTAGAHIDLTLPGGLSRSYSLINPQCETHRYVVAVNRDPKSRGGSAYICETLRVGDVLRVAPPRNSFPLDEKADMNVLFAGGIGVTPILSMILRLEELDRPWRLYYAVRNRANAAFVDQLARLSAPRPGRMHLHVDEEAGSVMDIAALAAQQPAGAHLYCCGPTPMIDAFSAATKGRLEDSVHIEHFKGAEGAVTTSFTVLLKRSNREFKIEAGQTIMQVLMDAGLRVAHSCREGVCGTCETRVLEGVPDHKDNILSARERASNKIMMICCSGAVSDRLVLDL